MKQDLDRASIDRLLVSAGFPERASVCVEGRSGLIMEQCVVLIVMSA